MIEKIQGYKYTALYCFFVVTSAIGFHFFPGIVALPGDWGAWTPWTLAVGVWFVLRDFAQRELGHKVLLPMLGAVVVAALINPQFAVANMAAAAASEVADYFIYSFTKKPFHQRILLSSFAAAPVDSAVFLNVTDFLKILPFPIFTMAGIITGASAKLIAAFFIYYYYKKEESGQKLLAS